MLLITLISIEERKLLQPDGKRREQRVELKELAHNELIFLIYFDKLRLFRSKIQIPWWELYIFIFSFASKFYEVEYEPSRLLVSTKTREYLDSHSLRQTWNLNSNFCINLLPFNTGGVLNTSPCLFCAIR